MPNSRRLQWPYPGELQDPWFSVFESMVTAQDSTGYANREDRQLIMAKGGTWTFDAGTGILSWSGTLEILSMIGGYRINLPAGSVTLLDSQLFYVVLTRSPTADVTVSAVVANHVPNTDDAYIIGIRRGNDVYFRTGVKLGTGESADIFAATGGASTTDIYERQATFGVSEGSATTEATVGRILYAGSLVGVGAEITRGVVGGSVTVNVKVNDVATMTVVLNTSFPIARSTLVAGGTYQVLPSDSLTVEVISSSYDNADDLDAGLTVTMSLLAGVNIEPGDIPDASTSTKGVTKLSFAPSVANNPIAYGSNDPQVARLDTQQTFTKSQGVALVTLTYGATINTNANLGNTFMVTLTGDGSLANPTNLHAGYRYTWIVKQDGSGSHSMDFGTLFMFPSGIAPTITPGANAVDVIHGVYDGTNIYCYFDHDYGNGGGAD